MKIAIVTITNGANYGNRLQNYALQTVLQNMGHEVETLRMLTSKEFFCMTSVKYKCKTVLKTILKKSSHKIYNQRKIRFNSFNDKNIVFSPYSVKCSAAPKVLNEQYDLFVCGSDQVWNPRIPLIKEALGAYLCDFAQDSKRTAYAASFATGDVPPEFEEKFKSELPGFKCISLREESGKALVKKLCGIDAPVVLDPTMLLNAEQWRKIEKKPDYIKNEKFIVTYFLAGRKGALGDYIEKIRNEFNADLIINLDFEFLDDKKIENPEHFNTDPSEFLWLIDHAECMLTDSFHGSVFSILFHTPFCVFERQEVEKGNNMSSRITTLLGKFGLEECKDSLSSPKKIPQFSGSDKVEDVLSKERKTSLAYLENAVK